MTESEGPRAGATAMADGQQEEELHYLQTPAEARSFLQSIGSAGQIAIDTEGASFHRFVDRIYLIQLSTREETAVIDPLSAGALPDLGKMLQDRSVEVVLHDADYDLRLLHQDYGWHPNNIFDTRVAAQLLGITAFGLAALLQHYLGIALEKKHQRADWSMRPLPADMLEYAREDTRHLLELRDILSDELVRVGRREWAAEEFALLEGTKWDNDPALAFMRIKGARDLSRRELAVFAELVSWRDKKAAEVDRAVFRVMPNEVLLELARLTPDRQEQLLGVKGMPRALAHRSSDEIIAAVRRGLAMPEADLPKYERALRWHKDPEFDGRLSRLRTAREAEARRLQMDPGVMCSRERLEAVARRNPQSLDEVAEVAELRRWQQRELGPAFVAALQS